MINKLDLVSIISKYYLNGMNEAVKWEIKDKKLIIKFTSPNKMMIGMVTYDGMDLEDSIIGVSNTTQLNKLIAITNGYVNLEYIKNHKLITKLIISDNQFTTNYALADTMIIPKPGEYIGDGVYNIEADLDNESINAIVKAKSALADSETVVFKPFIIGIGLTVEQIKTFECVGDYYDFDNTNLVSDISSIISKQKLIQVSQNN